MVASVWFCSRPVDKRLVDVLLEQVLEQIAIIVESTKPNDTIAKADFKEFMLPLMSRSTTGVET